MRPVLFYTVGYPGAGKTTLASRLSSWLNAAHLRGDQIGVELFHFPTYSAHERQAVYAEMGQRAADQLAAGKHVIYDATCNTLAQRQQLAQLAQRYGGQAIGVWVHVAPRLAQQRAATVRGVGPNLGGRVVRVIPPHLFKQYVQAFETPQRHERVIVISGDAAFPLQYRRLQRQLGLRGLPRLV